MSVDLGGTNALLARGARLAIFAPVNGTPHCCKRNVAPGRRPLGGAKCRRSALESGKGSETLRRRPRRRQRGGHHSSARITARPGTPSGRDTYAGARTPPVGPSSTLPLPTVPLLRHGVP